MQKNNLLKHTLLFSAFVLLAQITGLVRDLLLARYFGVGYTLDTYYLAFKVPDFLNVFYSVFLGSVVFIPMLAKAGSKEEIVKTVRTIGSLVFYLVVLIGIVLFIFMPEISVVLAPTWSASQQELHTSLSRILLLAQFFFPIGILAGSIGMMYDRPFYMAASGFVYNFFILLSVFIFSSAFGIYGAVGGVLFGAMMFALVQMIPKEVRGVFKEFRLEFNSSAWVHFFKSNFARFFAVLAYQLFGVLLMYIATFSGTGGVSVFTISYNLYLAMFFILGASMSTAAMPSIAKHHVYGNTEAQKENLNNSIIYMFFVGIFITLFAYIFSFEIVKILYYFSHISPDKEMQIGQTFALLVLALPFFNLLEIIRKYLYSTNQIPLAGAMTIFLLFSVLLFAFVFNKILMMAILSSLGIAIFFSNVLCLFLALFVLSKKGQITLPLIFKNSWKVVVVSIVSFVVFMSSKIYFSHMIENFFIEAVLEGIILFVIFAFFATLFQDKIGKTVFESLYKRLI